MDRDEFNSTPVARRCLQEIYRILESPRPTPTEHWKKVLAKAALARLDRNAMLNWQPSAPAVEAPKDESVET